MKNGSNNNNNSNDDNNKTSMNNESVALDKHPLHVITYQDKKVDHVLKSLKKGMRIMLPNKVKPQIAFTGRKVVRSFQSKYKTEMKHNLDTVWYNDCLEGQYNESYIAKTRRKTMERIMTMLGETQNLIFTNMVKKLVIGS